MIALRVTQGETDLINQKWKIIQPNIQRCRLVPRHFPESWWRRPPCLSFITFWRAAAIVLNDLASSAYYAGGIAEHFVGKSAPWFILAVMLLSYAVCQLYVESCSMFVRGGVYRVVKEAMGWNPRQIFRLRVDVRLHFDRPHQRRFRRPVSRGISQRTAGPLPLFHRPSRQLHCRRLRHSRHALFLAGEYQGDPGIQREGAAHHARHHGHGGA